ncbi:hypothetical protein BpHYR1_046334, partial [Brachionus plicatilis]
MLSMSLANQSEIPRWIFKNSVKLNLKKLDKPVSHKTLFSALDIALNLNENDAITSITIAEKLKSLERQKIDYSELYIEQEEIQTNTDENVDE